MRVLVTGFEPFNGESINPSWQVAQRISADRINAQLADADADAGVRQISIVPLQIPTVFTQAVQSIIAKIHSVRPDVVLSLGQFGGASSLHVEYVGINMRVANIADNAGNAPQYEPCNEQGPNAYFATVPVVRIVEALRSKGIPAEVSYTAGTYVCNDVLYGVLDYAAEHQLALKSGFIHVPYMPEQVVARPSVSSMSLTMMVQGVETAIATIAAER